MTKHLTFKDNKTDKYWSIETADNYFIITYGKTGADGMQQTKIFEDETRCEREAEKAVREKLKKGYIVTSPTVMAVSEATI